MSAPARAGEPSGRFLDLPHGRIFCVSTLARSAAWVVVAAPFAEEMNKCRRMWTLLGGELASAGIALLIVDLYGTGESDGDFADARWPLWRADLEGACARAREQGARRVALLGVRLGALLALDVARNAGAAVDRLILWQPVINGQQHMNQFLRLKLAAGLRQSTSTKETTTTLRSRLAGGERLEVAGYEFAPGLLTAIDALEGGALVSPQSAPIDWLEVSTSDPPALLPASERVVEKWRAAGVTVRCHVVPGEAFWALQEITIAPALNTLTCAVAREALVP